METPTIYFDEAGNTGAALYDQDQPVFVLASVDLSNDESKELLDLIRTEQTGEVKFSTLRRTLAGQRRVLDFLRSELLSAQRVKTTVTHKHFMIVTKLVDIIEETLAYADGIDLYERGGNIALSNLHYYVSPVFCGRERFEEFLSSFVEMIRTPTIQNKSRFFRSARAMHDGCSHPDHRLSFGPYIYAERFIDDILDGVTYLNLDPAIPSFFNLCVAWGDQVGLFNAIHDSSKPMAAERATFEAMMDQNIQPTLIGYDRRKFEFPLKANGINFADSRDHASIQVADLLAGATAYYTASIARQRPDDFVIALEEAGIKRFVINALWPSVDVTPETLGTNEVGGINAADHIADILARTRR